MAESTDKRITAFRWLERAFRNDPKLRRLVKTWQVWDGATQSAPLPDIDAWSVRLTPSLDAATFHSAVPGRVAYQYPVTVKIDARCTDKSWPTGIDFWRSIEDAIRYANDATTAAAEVGGVNWWEWVQPATRSTDGVGDWTGTIRLMTTEYR